MAEQVLKDEINRIFEKTALCIESNENKRREKMWSLDFKPSEYEPGLIPPLDASEREEKRPPLTADWDRLQWSRFLEFDLKRYYTDPLYYLKWTLEINLFRFNSFPDDTPLTSTIPIFLGVAFEPNLFGVPTIYSTEHEPLFTSDGAVIKKRSDLLKLKTPDFFTSGPMPLSHRFYQTLNETVPRSFSVEFPVWLRGPFGVACAMRSMQNLLMDMIDDPQFVHDLMHLITESRKEFSLKRGKFTRNRNLMHGSSESSMANDEVSIPMVSPSLYETLILPYELELERFYGGIHWWHSCGNKTPLLPAIKNSFTRIEFIDFALWSDNLQKAVRELDGSIPFHVRPQAGDIAQRSEELITNHLQGIFSICRGQNFALRVDGLQPDTPDQKDVDAVRRYLNIARRIGEENIPYETDENRSRGSRH